MPTTSRMETADLTGVRVPVVAPTIPQGQRPAALPEGSADRSTAISPPPAKPRPTVRDRDQAVNPPSTFQAMPVMKDASGLTK
jgi:hypothetical protein